MTELEAGGVRLRPWQAGDEASLARYADNRKIWINLRDRFPHPYTLQDAREWIERAGRHAPPRDFAVEVDARAVGGIGLTLGEDIFRRTAEIGYWLGEPYWGRGIMTTAVRLVTAYGFETFDLVRIHAGVLDGNRASARVLEKAGYTLECRMRKAVVKAGRVLDQLLYAALR